MYCTIIVAVSLLLAFTFRTPLSERSFQHCNLEWSRPPGPYQMISLRRLQCRLGPTHLVLVRTVPLALSQRPPGVENVERDHRKDDRCTFERIEIGRSRAKRHEANLDWDDVNRRQSVL